MVRSVGASRNREEEPVLGHATEDCRDPDGRCFRMDQESLGHNFGAEWYLQWCPTRGKLSYMSLDERSQGLRRSIHPNTLRVPLLCSGFADTWEPAVWAAFQGRAQLPGVDFQAVRARVSMAHVLGLLAFVPCETRGEQLRGPCPIHGSTSPESRVFSVHLTRSAFRCFKCGASGNQLDLWSAATKTDLHAATIDLCRRLQIEIPWIAPCELPTSSPD